MIVRDIMSSPAITVTATTKVQEVARLLREHHISGVPVVDELGGLLGIVTELDLIARNAPLKQPRYLAVLSGLIPVSVAEYRRYKEQLLQVLATNASELMGRDDLERSTVAPDDTIDEAMARMLHPEITMLPVLEDGRVIGVITRTDIVWVLEQLETADGEEKQ